MKQLILIIAIATSFSGFAQEGTSLEEYRYLSKGYVYQLEMGLDAQKEGYLVKKLFHASNEADLVGLYYIGNVQPRALLVIMNNEQGKTDYICIPNSTADQRVRDLAAADHNSISAQQKVNYQAALNEFLFEALSNPDLKMMAYQRPKNSSPTIYEQDETLVSRSANLKAYIPTNSGIERVEMIEPEIQAGNNKKAATQTVKGEIADRSIVYTEDAYAATTTKGVVAIKVCVNTDGEVISAKFTQRGSTTFNSNLKKVALKAAKNIKFAPSDDLEQCGIINYKF